jgi:ABC-2 type transport system ATP-binding protein
MRRRLDLGMALIHEPRVLFLDEPTTGLDPASRATIWDEVRKLNDEGTTVFLTTQYLEEADELADRVGIIDRGRMAVEGTPAQLKARVGAPHLELVIADGTASKAAEALAPFGAVHQGGTACDIQVTLERGTEQVAPVVRALDAAGVQVAQLNLVEPTLDDVFLIETGHHLEAEDGAGEEEGEST